MPHSAAATAATRRLGRGRWPGSVDHLRAYNGRGRGGHAIPVSDRGGRPLSSDLSGVPGGPPARRWPESAGPDELVFAGYNGATRYGAFVLIRAGRGVRGFLGDALTPESSTNRGASGGEGEPFENRADVAPFVDADELGGFRCGLLRAWGPAAGPAAARGPADGPARS